MEGSFERVLIARKWRDLGIKIEGPSDSTGCQGPKLEMKAPKGRDKSLFWNAHFSVTSGQVSPEARVVCSSKKSNLRRCWLVSSLSRPSFFLLLFWILQVARLLQLILSFCSFPYSLPQKLQSQCWQPKTILWGEKGALTSTSVLTASILPPALTEHSSHVQRGSFGLCSWASVIF